ncbi:MAG: bile acid:sodium symporter [Prevotellaceae bacterium]|nr:bile acid:sodium symporter [Prevotellaceae bacterium]
MSIAKFIKKWTLPCAMVVGAIVYTMFTAIKPLEPVGEAVAPYILNILPVVIFLMLYVTFCKIQIDDLRPRTWHFWLQGIRITLSAIMVAIIALVKDMETKIILEGVFICIICPTAAAAPVITEKLGGSIESLTVYTLIANVVTSIIIPLFFPMVEKGADITFSFAFIMILKRVVTVLLLPLCLALLTRRYLPKFAEKIKKQKDLAFYMWGFNLSIMMGLTLHYIVVSEVSGMTLLLLLFLPLGVTLLLFGIGKGVGHCYGESISAGQALGQKNTMVGIWLTVTFLNPVAAVAPCAYVIWQNLVNSWQLWYKDKYGELKW